MNKRYLCSKPSILILLSTYFSLEFSSLLLRLYTKTSLFDEIEKEKYSFRERTVSSNSIIRR